jgi:hypothetical protein
MECQRQRDAERRPARDVTPEAKVRWNRTHKLSLKGPTWERFQELIRAQGYACAMCPPRIRKGSKPWLIAVTPGQADTPADLGPSRLMYCRRRPEH